MDRGRIPRAAVTGAARVKIERAKGLDQSGRRQPFIVLHGCRLMAPDTLVHAIAATSGDSSALADIFASSGQSVFVAMP